VGNFKHNFYHGKGIMNYGNGDVYEGHWHSGLYHGKGRHTLNNGCVMECEFI